MEEEPADRIIFFVPKAYADASMQALVNACNLGVPGRGSIICEDVDIIVGSAWEDNPIIVDPGVDTTIIRDNMVNITCTVVKGEGNAIANAVLGLGMPMPQVTTGLGMGLRDKLGLVRIALSAEKEVVHAKVSKHEANDILDSIIDAGKLDRFGSGFIYMSPITKGVFNTMVIRGQRYTASIEQIIAAVDDLKRSTNWRKRSFGSEGNVKKRTYMHDLVSLTLICNEGRATDLVRAAMAVGAGGATIGKLSYTRIDGAKSAIIPAREITDLVVGKGVVDDIVKTMEAEGVFDNETAGIISLKPVMIAYTYKGARR